MKEIVLTQSKVALVDDEDYEYISQWNWYAMYTRGSWYAARCVRGRHIWMHREIMNTPTDLLVDHKDNNGLNNQRYNLRNCTQSVNIQNMRSRDGYRGVSYHRTKYRSRIEVNGRQVYLGLFIHAKDAAKAYNTAATKYFGEFARLNIIPDEVNL